MTLWEKLTRECYDKPEHILARVKQELAKYPMGAVSRKVDRLDLAWLIETAEKALYGEKAA